MHVHLPKPLHGWRAFAGEVGIIVIGVLIALMAEAAVERYHEAEQFQQAEERMTSEIRDDDLPQAFARAAINSCNEQQLTRIEDAIARGDRAALSSLVAAYKPPFRTWDDDAWKAANTSQALRYADGDRAFAWSSFYLGMPLMNQWSSEEQEALRQLRAKLGGSGNLTTSQQDRLFELLATLHGTNDRLTGGSLASLLSARKIGIGVTARDRREILAEARAYGSCVIDPYELLKSRPSSRRQYIAPA